MRTKRPRSKKRKSSDEGVAASSLLHLSSHTSEEQGKKRSTTAVPEGATEFDSRVVKNTPDFSTQSTATSQETSQSKQNPTKNSDQSTSPPSQVNSPNKKLSNEIIVVLNTKSLSTIKVELIAVLSLEV